MKSDHPVLDSRYLLFEAQQAHHFGLPVSPLPSPSFPFHSSPQLTESFDYPGPSRSRRCHFLPRPRRRSLSSSRNSLPPKRRRSRPLVLSPTFPRSYSVSSNYRWDPSTREPSSTRTTERGRDREEERTEECGGSGGEEVSEGGTGRWVRL